MARRWSERTTARTTAKKRVIALGIADGIPLTVVYTDRAEVVARSPVELSRLE
jgi:hypothetical protein